ncbi:MAG: radical SAM protein [Actinobacteria bacterium]|nr:radical SAM protein [Actinomycetota bacterium]
MRLQNRIGNRVWKHTLEKSIDLAIRLISSASDDNLIRLTYALERLAPSSTDAYSVRVVRDAFRSGHPSIILAKKLGRGLSENYRRGLANFLVRTLFYDSHARIGYEKKHGFSPPFTVLISPTMRCNLSCDGCFAGEYSEDDDLSAEVMQRIINEGRNIGIGFYTILGGEPLLYKPLFNVIEQSPDSIFQIFTNATMVNERVVERLGELGNAILVLSLEGLQRETDDRRGRGIFDRVMRAADLLRESRAPFMFSVTPTRKNAEVVVSDEFIGLMIEKGAVFGWYFSYMPVGRKPDLSLMPTPEQRDYVRRRVNEIRSTKPIILIDFWGDGALVSGCLAGGRQFIHITNNGDVEPCIFCHVATHNIKETSLVEALNSEFFKAIRKAQPFGHNHIRPCPLIDHPGAMAGLVKRYGAVPTHEGADKILSDFIPELREYSTGVKEIYKDVWEEEYGWYERWVSR